MVINWFLLAILTFDYSFTKEQDLHKCSQWSEEIVFIWWLFAPKTNNFGCIDFLWKFRSRVQLAKKFSLFFSCCVRWWTRKKLINKTLRKELVSLFEKEFEWRCTLMSALSAVFLFEMHCRAKIFALYFHPIAALERVDFTSLISKGKQRRMSRVLECIFVNDFFWWRQIC